MPAVVVVHQLCDEADGAEFSRSSAERGGHLQGGGYPIALVWSCLLWEDLEPRFGDTEVPLPESFCFRLEGGVRGGPVAFILSFS